MGQTPEQLRSEIARQREDLAADVNAIEDRVTPGRIAERKKVEYQYRAGQRWNAARNSIFGDPAADEAYYAAAHPTPSVHSNGGDDDGAVAALKTRVGNAAGGVSDAATNVPQQVVQHTQGAPLAAGLIALGAGLLIGALLPESAAERRAVQRVQPQLDAAAAHVADVGRESADHLAEPAADAAQSLKSSAQEAVTDLRGQATDAASTVAADTKGG